MGRAGRGGGGGHHGGSRGFSSHSSHRSSYSSSRSRSSYSSGSHSSYHHHYSSGPRFVYVNNSGNHYGGYRSSGSYVDSGRLIRIFVWIILGIVVLSTLYDIAGSDDVQKSTIEREKLSSSGIVELDEYFTDELGWISSRSEVEKGMKHFYKETGVQPYLLITDTIEGTSTDFSESTFEDFANDYYDNLFEDEAHLLVIFFERDGMYRTCCVVGSEAKTVVDEEAREIILDYIDHYYYSDYSEDEFFSRSFSESADRMMKITPDYKWVIGLLIVCAVILFIVYRWWKKNKQHKLDEMNEAEKILGSNLGEFGTGGYNGYNAGDMNNNTNYGYNGGYGYNGSYGTGQNMGQYNPSSPASDIDELKKKYDN